MFSKFLRRISVAVIGIIFLLGAFSGMTLCVKAQSPGIEELEVFQIEQVRAEMPQIQVLDQITIDKIAAGEVIERPASIVKELVENSIDAKAASVTVEIQDGGISLIRVTDNGSGIEREDIRNAFLRHSTSKIRTSLKERRHLPISLITGNPS